MRLRSRVFLGILVVVGIGFAFLLNWMLDDGSPQYRKVTEEPLERLGFYDVWLCYNSPDL